MTEVSEICHLARPSRVFKRPCQMLVPVLTFLKLDALGASSGGPHTAPPCGAGKCLRTEGCRRRPRSQGSETAEEALEQASCGFPEAPRSPECCARRTLGPERLQQWLGWRDPRGSRDQFRVFIPAPTLGMCGCLRPAGVRRWIRCLDAAPGWGRMFGWAL